jgi:hypothetical protein
MCKGIKDNQRGGIEEIMLIRATSFYYSYIFCKLIFGGYFRPFALSL